MDKLICEHTTLRRDAVITIYKRKIVLSARACFILRLDGGPRCVRFSINDNKVCVSHADNHDKGFAVTFRKGRKTGQISSTELAGELAYLLGGYGIYKLSSKICFTEKGTRLFQIIK